MPWSTLPRFLLIWAPHAGGAAVENQAMEMMHERVAGLDVHKATIVACVRVGTGRKVTRECRTFDTTTDGLLALLAWLVECRCSHVAMEATGVYWMPVWKILSEGDFVLIVANAAHIKNVPGRKRTCRNYVRCCAPASSWGASRPGMSSGYRRRWQRPTSNWTRYSAISWAPPGGGSSRR